MSQPPPMVTIGAHLVPKRGHRVTPISVRMIHRADRAVSAIDADGSRRTILWRDLRKHWRAS